jgi:hypothetical protein
MALCDKALGKCNWKNESLPAVVFTSETEIGFAAPFSKVEECVFSGGLRSM